MTRLDLVARLALVAVGLALGSAAAEARDAAKRTSPVKRDSRSDLAREDRTPPDRTTFDRAKPEEVRGSMYAEPPRGGM